MHYTSLPKNLFFSILFLISSLSLSAQVDINFPSFSGGMNITETMKVDNNGTVSNLFDEISFRGEIALNQNTLFYALIDFSEVLYKAGLLDVYSGFDRTEVYLDSDVLPQAGLNLHMGYGSHQELLVMDFTQYRFERSSTSGIDGFNFSTTLGWNHRFFLTTAFNPVSFENINTGGYPDIFTSFFMDNDHRGSSWGPLISFTSSSMQLFYDSSSNLGNNRLLNDSNPGEAMTLGIGGTLVMDFAGIDILGFGMTEYFLMYNRNNSDILQAQWGAGFTIPALSGIDANLSGSNAMILSDSGDSSYMNFGLDVKAMITDIFGVFGAVAGIGILDNPGTSAEGGVCLSFNYFQVYTGYSNLAIGTDEKYAKGAFDKVEVTGNGSAPGGGFFLTLKASY